MPVDDLYNINIGDEIDVQRKNVVNSVDMSSLRAPCTIANIPTIILRIYAHIG